MNDDHDLLVRLDEKFDALIKTITDKFTNHSATLQDHEKRLRALEASKEQAAGVQIEWGKILTAIGAVGGVIGAIYWINH
jgi:hypothetical protein